MGPLLFTADQSSDLCIGVTFVILILLGKISMDRDLLKISHNGRAILQMMAVIVIALEETSSKPALLQLLRCYTSYNGYMDASCMHYIMSYIYI